MAKTLGIEQISISGALRLFSDAQRDVVVVFLGLHIFCQFEVRVRSFQAVYISSAVHAFFGKGLRVKFAKLCLEYAEHIKAKVRR